MSTLPSQTISHELTDLTPAALQTWLEDHKMRDITTIDVQQLTPIIDQIIICTATSKRQLTAITQRLLRDTKGLASSSSHAEGIEEDSDWALIDLGGTVVHIMLAETRDYYQLEKLWSQDGTHTTGNPEQATQDLMANHQDRSADDADQSA